ncbi:MAG: TonB-dependent receptor, partial [Vitreoscilla sp.]|nr:TonB-dependent receptor [Vitreoscilla sp.]
TNHPSGLGAANANAVNGSSGAYYEVHKTYSEVLPGLSASLQVTPELQAFAGLAKNFKAPGNFEYYNLGNGVSFANGVGTLGSLAPLTVKQETSTNLDLGLRYRNSVLKGSVTAYFVDFKDRIARSFNPVTQVSHDWNVGSTTTQGLEVELGTAPVAGFSAYASASYTKSTLDGDLARTATTVYATQGKQMPDTPKGMATLGLQYASGPLVVNLNGKYTSGRYLTLVNDLRIAGYTTLDANLAYQLPSFGFFKNPLVRLNVSNLSDHRYLLANSGSGSSMAFDATGNPSVYLGAPRFASITLQSDF